MKIMNKKAELFNREPVLPWQKNKFPFILLVAGITLFLFFIVFLNPSISMDEIWIYQYARRILYQQIPYKDFSMIVTPLKAQVDSLFLQWTTDQLYILRLVAIVTACITGYIFYLISKVLNMSLTKKLILILSYFLCFSLFPINNYNWLSVLWLSFLLYLLLIKKSVIQSWLIGFSIALLFLTKQNLGIYTLIGLGYLFLKYKGFKILPLALGFSSVIIPEIIYFWNREAMYDFLSIFTKVIVSFYQERIFFHSWWSMVALLCFVGFSIYLFLSTTDEQTNYLLVFSYIAAGFLFPILDLAHFYFAFTFFLLIFLLKVTIFKRSMIYFLFFLLCFRIFGWFLSYNASSTTNLPHYHFIPMEKGTWISMISVIDFINQSKTNGISCFVIDFTNVRYDIALNRFSFKYDSMMRESLGKEGEKEILDRIKEEKNLLVVFFKNNRNKQQQTKITDYVKKNFQLVETFNPNYLVFEKK